MTTLKTLIAAALVATSSTVAFANNGNALDKQDIFTVFAMSAPVEGRNAAAAQIATPRSDSWAGIHEHVLNDRAGPVEGRNSLVIPPVSPAAPEGSNR